MQRLRMTPREDWRRRCEEAGFAFHSIDGLYWDESACYVLSSAQVDELEAATGELHRLCLQAADEVVRTRRYGQFAIAEEFAERVAQSWTRGELSLYGRFDLAWDGSGPPKMLEYNADTPTALLEAGVVQWFWLEDLKRRPAGGSGPSLAGADQFNSVHEKLIERWRGLAAAGDERVLHFACCRGSEEDEGTVAYLRDTAAQAGIETRFLYVEDIGWNEPAAAFVSLEDEPIDWLFKLYPWEWLVREDFGRNILRSRCRWTEPPWKMLLSNKAILPVLWELFPGHPNLLPAYFDAAPLAGSDYVRKPILAREGANVSLRRKSGALMTGGSYGAEGHVYQAHAPLARFEDRYAVIGSWIVGEQAAGIGIREDDTPITRNTSRFVPHYFE